MNNNTLPLLLLFLLSGNDGASDNRTMLAMCLSLLLLFDDPSGNCDTF